MSRLSTPLENSIRWVRNTFAPPPAKLAARELGAVLMQRNNNHKILETLLGPRVSSDRSGQIFTPVYENLLEPKILHPDVSDSGDMDGIKKRYGENIVYRGTWEKKDGTFYMRVLDIADDVREAVLRIAEANNVHFMSSHSAYGGSASFIDEFVPPASMEKDGNGGYAGCANVSFAGDREAFGEYWTVEDFKKTRKAA